MMKKAFFFALIALAFAACNSKHNNELQLLVGTYTGNSKGIYTYFFDEENGTSRAGSLAEVENPSFLTFSDDGNFVYAVSEGNSEETSAVNVFNYNKKTNTLSFINKQPAGGASPCYITFFKNHVFVANYGSGSVSVFPIEENGALAQASQIVNLADSANIASNAHCVIPAPDDNLLVCDLGQNAIFGFSFDEKNGMQNKSEFQLKNNAGPRHLVFHNNRKFVYLITEKSGEVMCFNYEFGNLELRQTIAADTVGAHGSADIHISPDGKFLYASNRLKADGIAIFSIDAQSGRLKKIGYQQTGLHPRNFAITPNGKFLLCANRDSNQIQVFARNSETGFLTDTKQNIELSKPVCLKFSK